MSPSDKKIEGCPVRGHILDKGPGMGNSVMYEGDLKPFGIQIIKKRSRKMRAER